jgi:hypothetical protein
VQRVPTSRSRRRSCPSRSRAGPAGAEGVRGGAGADHRQGRARGAARADLAGSTLIAFANGCSYRKRLEEWLGARRDAGAHAGVRRPTRP